MTPEAVAWIAGGTILWLAVVAFLAFLFVPSSRASRAEEEAEDALRTPLAARPSRGCTCYLEHRARWTVPGPWHQRWCAAWDPPPDQGGRP